MVLMVSGGADSTALLLMACTSKLDIQDGRGVAPIARERLHVLHVNHHLRGKASDGDEAFVRELCAQYGLPLCVEHAYFDGESGNIEAAAREVRYAAARRYVRELCAQTGAPRTAARICTAHTSSDRAETFLMNAIKGSGPAGLSSIPRRRNIVVRPLLDLTHGELVGYLQVHGQPWREDESNEDISYLRNYVRHRVMPVVAQRNASVCKTIGAACEILGDEDAF
ncbi:tRNA lysidine(34) synthetase TilS, partial [Bacteroides fragilis]